MAEALLKKASRPASFQCTMATGRESSMTSCRVAQWTFEIPGDTEETAAILSLSD